MSHKTARYSRSHHWRIDYRATNDPAFDRPRRLRGQSFCGRSIARGRIAARLRQCAAVLDPEIEAGMATHYVARELVRSAHVVKQVPPAQRRPRDRASPPPKQLPDIVAKRSRHVIVIADLTYVSRTGRYWSSRDQDSATARHSTALLIQPRQGWFEVDHSMSESASDCRERLQLPAFLDGFACLRLSNDVADQRRGPAR